MGNGLCSGTGDASRNSSPPTSPTVRTFEARTPGTTPSVPRASATTADSNASQFEISPGLTGSGAQGPATPPSGPGGGRVPLMPPTPADRKAAEDLKAEGNTLFSKGKYAAAIEKYTEAITLCPEWSVLYINRGMAARKRGEWERVEADSGVALGLSPGEREAMKGHYLLGLAMGARGEHERSTHHLRKALDAAREANDSIKDEIWRELATANYLYWQTESTARKQRHVALKRQLAELRPGSGKPAAAGNSTMSPEWEELFKAAAWQDVAKEAPSQFTCPLTMEIFRDPVVVPSGRSYERSALLEHLKKVGRFDPITRQSLSEEQLIPNVSLRAAIEVYLEEHPWCWGEVK